MDCVAFTLLYPTFMVHSIILSICSATGQMFIFYTLSTYGALVFTIIMTT
jgi:adenosine 3'-phospho 5'-phosphosulfate transporter B2